MSGITDLALAHPQFGMFSASDIFKGSFVTFLKQEKIRNWAFKHGLLPVNELTEREGMMHAFLQESLEDKESL
jgi:hypothetical protein